MEDIESKFGPVDLEYQEGGQKKITSTRQSLRFVGDQKILKTIKLLVLIVSNHHPVTKQDLGNKDPW